MKFGEQRFQGVGGKFVLLTCLLLFGAISLGILNFYSISRLHSDLEGIVQDSIPVIRNLTLIDMVHDGVRGASLDAFVAVSLKDKKRLEGSKSDLQEHRDNVKNSFAVILAKKLSEEDRKLVDEAKLKMEEYLAAADSLMLSAEDGDLSKVSVKMGEFQEKFEELEKLLSATGDHLQASIEKDSQDSIARANWAGNVSLICLLFVVLLGFTSAWKIAKNVTSALGSVVGQLSTGSKGIGMAVTDLTAASKDLSVASSNQAVALEQTSTAVEQISAMVTKSADFAKSAEGSSKESKNKAENGRATMEKMAQAMSAITNDNKKIYEIMAENNQKISTIQKLIQEVGAKTSVINDIVLQTKLLSFNASVEAVRAGENGKGFSVVAQEVGKLAEMSGNAAIEINKLLQDSFSMVSTIASESKSRVDEVAASSQRTLESGLQVLKESDAMFGEIVVSSVSVAEMVASIAKASEECSKGVSEIALAVNQLEQATQKNSVSASSCARASEDLSEQVVSLRAAAKTLGSVVGEGSEARVENAPRRMGFRFKRAA